MEYHFRPQVQDSSSLALALGTASLILSADKILLRRSNLSALSQHIVKGRVRVLFVCCGGGEIRTLETFRFTRFPSVRTRPLCDASVLWIYSMKLERRRGFSASPQCFASPAYSQPLCFLLRGSPASVAADECLVVWPEALSRSLLRARSRIAQAACSFLPLSP